MRRKCRTGLFSQKHWGFSQKWNAPFQSCYQFSQHMAMVIVGVASLHRNSIVEKVSKKHTVIELSWKIGSTFFEQTAEVFTMSSQSKELKASRRKKKISGNVSYMGIIKSQNGEKNEEISFFWESNLLPFKTTVDICPPGYQTTFFLSLEITNFRTSQLVPGNTNLLSQSSQKVNIGLIRFKFLIRFPSKQQLSVFHSSKCHSKNWIVDRKIQFSLYFFHFFVKCSIVLIMLWGLFIWCLFVLELITLHCFRLEIFIKTSNRTFSFQKLPREKFSSSLL